MKRWIRLLAIGCALWMAVILNGCQKPASEVTEAGHYTLHTRMPSAEMNWNPHRLALSDDAEQYRLVGMSLTDAAEDGWVCEMATGFSDVTASLGEDVCDRTGISTDETGRAWRIELNQKATFADGTAITADDYLYSMQQLLDGELANPAAVRYTTGAAEMIGAHDYRHNGEADAVRYRRYVAALSEDGSFVVDESYEPGDKLFVSFDEQTAFGDRYAGGDTLNELYARGGEATTNFTVDGVDLHDKYADMDYIPFSEELMADMEGLCRNFGLTERDACQLLYLFADGRYETTPWSSVGFYKENDYTLVYLCARPTSEAAMWEQLSYPFLVYRPLYEAGKHAEDDRLVTTYGTSPDTLMSYGPYQLTDYREGLDCTLAANKKWYGYGDGKHQGQFQTTDIVCTALYDEDALQTALTEGKLDIVTLPTAETASLKGCHITDNGDGTCTLYTDRFSGTVRDSVRTLTYDEDDAAWNTRRKGDS